jgi:hypothetical protein
VRSTDRGRREVGRRARQLECAQRFGQGHSDIMHSPCGRKGAPCCKFR